MDGPELGTAEAIEIPLDSQDIPDDDDVAAAIADLEGDADGDV